MDNNYFKNSAIASAVNSFFQKNLEKQNEIIALEVFQDGELLVRTAPQPYSCSDKSELYSLSKSFTSIAVGLAVAEGYLTVDDYITSFFEQELPHEISENLASMQIKHLLSMNTGHEKCVMSSIVANSRGIAGFFDEPIVYPPGTHFVYNTGASVLLSVIVTKLTGQSLLDYLTPRLFVPLAITNVTWEDYNGYSLGGTGLCLSCDDIAKFGLLCLNNGIYNGKQLVPKSWIELATAFHSDNSTNGTPDWQAGYGYQFWRNSSKGYRGDGAFGQLCVVLPEDNMVVAVRANVQNMQSELTSLFEMVDELNSHHLLPHSDFLYTTYPPLSSNASTLELDKLCFRCSQNDLGVRLVSFFSEQDKVTLCMNIGKQQVCIAAGNNHWIRNRFSAKNMKPKLVQIMPVGDYDTIEMAASFTFQEDELIIFCRYLNTPHTETIKIAYDSIEKSINIHFECHTGLLHPNCTRLHGLMV